MKNKLIKTKILTGVMVGAMVLSTTTLSFAAVNNDKGTKQKTGSRTEYNTHINKKNFKAQKQAEMEATLEAVLKESVRSNIITQAESDKILAFENTKAKERAQGLGSKQQGKDGKHGLFEDLVKEGILTQVKADAIRAKMHAKRQEIRIQKLEDGLKTLVNNKKITQDQADKIEESIKSNNAYRKAEFEKIKNMTEEQRKAYMESAKKTKINPIKALVDDGTITKDQLEDIMSILPMGNHGHKGAGCPSGKE